MMRFGWILPIALASLVVHRLAAQTPEATGSLRGCITDPAGQSLPGVTVEVESGSVHQTVVSNRSGCYEFSDLAEASYIFFARLTGFSSFTRDEVRISPRQVVQLDFEMCVPAICECIVQPSLASLWKDTDAVVRVRITGHEPKLTSCGSLKHTATVVTSWKQPPKAIGPTLEFLEREPYPTGREYVLFLRSQLGLNDFHILSSFSIENERVRGFGVAGSVEKTVADFLAELERLAR